MSEVPVSVIIPVRDGADTIGRQLQAVIEQEVDFDFEVLVVDNGSTDGTVAAVEGFVGGRPPVRLVPGPLEPNRSIARNVGAAEAHGELLVFCDADDVVEPGWLAALVQSTREHPVVTGLLLRTSEEAGELSGGGTASTSFRGVPCLGSANFAIRRSLFSQAGGFSPDFRHRVDVELSCRLLAEHGVSVIHDPRARVRYVRRTNLRREARQHFWWAVADVQIQRRYRSAIQFRYSWRNSVKHWLTVGPRLLTAIAQRRDVTPAALTLAELAGRLVGSIRYRILAI